jgi:hypothetical protein
MSEKHNYSTLDEPKLEFALEVRLKFETAQHLRNLPSGISRSAVFVEEGAFEGPRLKGRALPHTGRDYAAHWPDKTLSLDARYLLQEEDGTLILLQNRGYIWGRQDDTLQKLYDFAFCNGPAVPHQEYYFRTVPTFEVPAGRHDWLNNHVFIGVGERLRDGNRIRYYAVA